jgi:LmbE family N-acetylglucosaminyl deacetylase
MTAEPAERPQGNAERFAEHPLPGGGTPAHSWITWGRRFADLDVASCPELVIVSPHPDDETLGLGATAALLSARGIEVRAVSVSDGGAGYPGLSPFESRRLVYTRRAELHKAASILGIRETIGLGLPDGELTEHESRLADRLTEILQARPPGTWCAATWRGDGHPDHEAVGRAAATAVERTAAVLLEYPVWMWHWAVPGDEAVPWEQACSVPLTYAATERKRLAAQSFRSQLEPPPTVVHPVLPPFVLRRLLAVGEVVFR